MKKVFKRTSRLGNSLLIVTLLLGAVVILALFALALWTRLSPSKLTTTTPTSAPSEEVSAPAQTVSDLDKYSRDLDATDVEALERQ